MIYDVNKESVLASRVIDKGHTGLLKLCSYFSCCKISFYGTYEIFWREKWKYECFLKGCKIVSNQIAK